jgi:hypothetical protein
VLVVVRTFTTVGWLFDLLPELLADLRIQVLFTLNGVGSAYQDGVLDEVRARGGRVLPWEQAVATRFDLAIAASYYGGLEQLCSPLLILPHGAAYGKLISNPQDGLGPLPAVDSKGPRTTIAIAHPDGGGRWRDHPDGQRVVVSGDTCFDRLEASWSSREDYRAALGVDDRRLVVLSSTWGPLSLMGQKPGLVNALLRELPVDEFVLAAALHPNIWIGHGSWQLRLWLATAIDSGLRLIPFAEGWRAMLVAGDMLIGDHGSVTVYGACLGLPTLLGAFGDGELLEESPTLELGRLAPRLEDGRPLLDQVTEVGFKFDRDRFAAVRDRSFAYRGSALTRLRSAVYELIGLPEREQPVRVLPVEAPKPEGSDTTALLAYCGVDGDSKEDLAIRVSRFPAAAGPSEDAIEPAGFLCVNEREPYRARRESASLIASAAPAGTIEQAESWCARTLDAYPGASLACTAVAGQQLVVSRDGVRVHLDGQPALDVTLAGCVVHALVAAGMLLGDGALTLRVGAESLRLRLIVMQAQRALR